MNESMVDTTREREVPRFAPGDRVRVLSFMGHAGEGGTPYVPLWVQSPLPPEEYLHAYPGELAVVHTDEGDDCYVVETHRGTFCVVWASELAITDSTYEFADPGHDDAPLSRPRDEAGEIIERLAGVVDFARQYPPGALAGEIWAIGYSQAPDWTFLHCVPDDAGLRHWLSDNARYQKLVADTGHLDEVFAGSEDDRWRRGFVLGAMRIWNAAVHASEIRHVLQWLRAEGVILSMAEVPR